MRPVLPEQLPAPMSNGRQVRARLKRRGRPKADPYGSTATCSTTWSSARLPSREPTLSSAPGVRMSSVAGSSRRRRALDDRPRREWRAHRRIGHCRRLHLVAHGAARRRPARSGPGQRRDRSQRRRVRTDSAEPAGVPSDRDCPREPGGTAAAVSADGCGLSRADRITRAVAMDRYACA